MSGHVGTSVPRREDRRLLTGRGRYVADLVDVTTLHAALVRSTQASASIRVDATAARDLPGVHLVLTGADLDGVLGPIEPLHRPHPVFAEAFGFRWTPRPIDTLAVDRVRYVGEPVAVVVADSRALAEDAIELVTVEYEPGRPVTSIEQALAPGAPRVHPDVSGNVAATLATSFGDVEAARERAAVVVRETYRMGRHGGVPIECRGVLAQWDPLEGRVHVRTSTQVPHVVRDAICAATGWPRWSVRVTVPDVGGGFGPKANVYPEEILVPYLARRLGRSVAWIEDRSEHFVATAQARDQVLTAELAVDADGSLLALSVDFAADLGAGSLWVAGIVANTAIHLLGPYRLPAYRVTGKAVYTNKTTVAQYRGAGRPEACFALERSLDAAADRLGIGREEIRRRNLLGAVDLPYARPLPYRDGVPITYDGGDYRKCLDACLELLPREAVAEAAARHPELAVGHGVGCYMEATGRGPRESARVRLLSDGRVELSTGAASAGQSHETTLPQAAADALGVSLDRIVWHPSDTDRLAVGVGTFASRTAVVAGNAVREVCVRMRERAVVLAAKMLGRDTADLSSGPEGFTAVSGETLTWEQLAGALALDGRLADEGDLDISGVYEPSTVTWTMGAHAAIVGVERATGLVRVLRYAVAHEGGVEINPAVVEGQIRGGVAQGIGGALLESFPYGPDGQPLTATFAEYLLPGTLDVPPVDIAALHTDATLNPLGVKGVGESGTIAVYATLASAVEDAVPSRRTGLTATPLRPADVHAMCGEDAR
ncbi:xanthine dehydrogenase family protein molybdopterin-binding subunit [Actinoallomurus sp. NBC_01490]|uniref:xanthine dehydrogenase family protein molybdopterin-binding subunit n=1 Tax=Actinoallomurus sp. NBC_01490 TaxID=2903557 RepID=UPI002E346A47|nr:xanthine dehydrogenase family protein molybdopterin-binding subunit [Actinoallomurus sp. NBC_01490]